MKHDLVEKENGFIECQACKRLWKRHPTGECQGYQDYAWGQAPENLRTESQLAKKRLNPGAQIRGSVVGWKLYDITEAIPFTDQQLADLHAKQRAARYKTCRRCKKTVSRKNWDRTYRMCDDCVPEYEREVRECEERERREYDEQLARDQARRRDKSIAWARKVLADGHAFILDTETTGLDYGDEIVAIGIIDLAGETVLQSLVKPSRPIPAAATRIHGITDEMVTDAPAFDWIYSQLINLLPGRTLISYNFAFDYGMLAYSMQKMGILATLLFDQSACAMKAYADFYGEWSEYWGNNKWQPLPAGDHSAVGDCLATLQLIKQMAEARLSTEEENHD